MADPNERTFSTDEVQANRAREQGLGQGQREMDAGRDPSREQSATAPQQRSFDRDLDEPAADTLPAQAERRDGWGLDPNLGRDEAGLGDVEGDLGAGTPANVDIHKLGQDDNPQAEWGEPADEGAAYSANHTRRPVRTEAERGQGARTRAANKDQVSRRG
ncbi:MAG: hypothetical protein JF588_17290 [Caulobacterales bacterium]|nr:hypothetical protein [Caulobacterales bacterium]